jgi:hypothetical protein
MEDIRRTPVITETLKVNPQQYAIPNFLRSNRVAMSVAVLAIGVMGDRVLGPATAYAQENIPAQSDTPLLECDPGTHPESASQDAESSEIVCVPDEAPEETPSEETVQERPAPKRPSNPQAETSQDIARDILRNKNIKFKVLHGIDKRDNSTPRDNIISVANGRLANTTKVRGCRPGMSTGSNRKARPSKKILRFIRDVGERVPIVVTSIVGQCHGRTSNHPKGEAVDIGCRREFVPRVRDLMRRIGKKVGVKKYRGESCTGHGHEHWSEDGR